jgi:hypothetical protein
MEQDKTDCNFIGNPKNAKFRFESFHNTKRIGFLLRIIAKQKVSKILFQRNRKKGEKYLFESTRETKGIGISLRIIAKQKVNVRTLL